MKRTNLTPFIAAIALISFLIWMLHRGHPVQPLSSLPENRVGSNTQSQPAAMPAAVLGGNAGGQRTENKSEHQASETKREAINQQNLNEWKTPIEFYGIVEDESNRAIADANIEFACNDLSPQGVSSYQTHSDMNGAFSIKDISGKLLRVTVSKTGYYPYQPNGGFFYYAGQNQNFVPEASNPVVFHLREKGAGANLIHYDKSFSLSRDGTPILIDLPSGTVMPSSENAFEVQGWTYDGQEKKGSKYDWRCRVSVPGGGLQTNDEEFPFLAPESGYLGEDIIDMPATNAVQWSYVIHRRYYIRTAGGNFGRMIFTMVAGGGNFCEINLYFNPSGSPNLEPAE